MTGNSLELTNAPSAVQCLTMCSGYEHTYSKSCDAARYNEVTYSCELMSRDSTGAVQWQVDNQWKVFVSKCQMDWTMFDVSCYQLFPITKSWDAARNACKQVNATLASITSKDEEDFINTQIKGISGKIYIGANDRDGEGHWKWESGEVWAYEHFAERQPDGGTSENVIGIKYNDGWHDVDGMITYLFYLCEKAIWF
ncbi:alpha-N-acetylgalactosamine-specific lectin-like [Mya arenaria]|uniref:alpha-N-acetylgalactosamine-specific lectin-like n=1 Tax=Mya arenaria TaxID=6604 RepID=UPI0022E48D13|nr:alpha-N-acetylgalactosamine-specific lectin-like [Mya arenaria]